MTKRAYKYRFHSTAEQAELLAKTFGCVRLVYNTLLRWRTDAFKRSSRKLAMPLLVPI
ncbi:helix-turn-helix domain-containing protein [Pseudomonas asuensis]|uniref:helix-turn-helix domain-containing protein n=1 Tax=Pseudomonas asuensis TaxID=1825787 RepID=UPI001E362D43|nr:helix-turn-helix domain-containing protein [Pseudomonas asuensis]